MYVRSLVKHGQENVGIQGTVTSNARTGNLLVMELVINVTITGNVSATSNVKSRKIITGRSKSDRFMMIYRVYIYIYIYISC